MTIEERHTYCDYKLRKVISSFQGLINSSEIIGLLMGAVMFQLHREYDVLGEELIEKLKETLDEFLEGLDPEDFE